MASATTSNNSSAFIAALVQWLVFVLVASIKRFGICAVAAFGGVDASFATERNLEAGIGIASTMTTQELTEIEYDSDGESITIVIIPTTIASTTSETPSVLPQVKDVSAEGNPTVNAGVRDCDDSSDDTHAPAQSEDESVTKSIDGDTAEISGEDTAAASDATEATAASDDEGENDDEVIGHLASESSKDRRPEAKSEDSDVATADCDDAEDAVETESVERTAPENISEEDPATETADYPDHAAEDEQDEEEESEEKAEQKCMTLGRNNCTALTLEDDSSDFDTIIVTDSPTVSSSESNDDEEFESMSNSDMDVEENVAEEDSEIMTATTTDAVMATAAKPEDLRVAVLCAENRELNRRLRDVQPKALRYTDSPEYKLMRAESLARRAKAGEDSVKPHFR